MLYAERELGQKLWCLLAEKRCGVFAGYFIVQIMITFADFIRNFIVNRIGDFFQTLTAAALQLQRCDICTRWL